MPGINPVLTGAPPPQTYTPTDAALDAAEDAVVPVTARDYPRIYKLLILANTILWIMYLAGRLK